jgi:hypothetical protein
VLTIAVVTEITRRQAIQRSLDPASTPAPSPTAARRDDRPGGGEATPPGAPGWYPDPSRGHVERFWDGAAWTERVRSNGVSSFAPVTPADWYPDPTGRFPLRYWTGYSWTEHVSRDNDLYVDPVEP